MFFILSTNFFNYDLTSFLVGGFVKFFGTGGAWRTHMLRVPSSNRGIDNFFFHNSVIFKERGHFDFGFFAELQNIGYF